MFFNHNKLHSHGFVSVTPQQTQRPNPLNYHFKLDNLCEASKVERKAQIQLFSQHKELKTNVRKRSAAQTENDQQRRDDAL